MFVVPSQQERLFPMDHTFCVTGSWWENVCIWNSMFSSKSYRYSFQILHSTTFLHPRAMIRYCSFPPLWKCKQLYHWESNFPFYLYHQVFREQGQSQAAQWSCHKQALHYAPSEHPKPLFFRLQWLECLIVLPQRDYKLSSRSLKVWHYYIHYLMSPFTCKLHLNDSWIHLYAYHSFFLRSIQIKFLCIVKKSVRSQFPLSRTNKSEDLSQH